MREPIARPSSQPAVADQVPGSRAVPLDAPWTWLAAGWRDLWAIPHISLTYGCAAAAGAAVIGAGLIRQQAVSAFLALAGGFLLIGPLLAVGLYDASRRLAAGQAPRLGEVIWAWSGARGQLGFLGVMLLFAFLVWMQLAFLLLMLFLGDATLPPPSAFMQTLLFTPRGLGLLIVGTAAGGLLAAVVFTISAFSVPMMLTFKVDAVTAAGASVRAVLADPKPMLLWAGLIALIMAAGFVTLLVGIVLAFPLIGHATWHAYTDIFGSTER